MATRSTAGDVRIWRGSTGAPVASLTVDATVPFALAAYDGTVATPDAADRVVFYDNAGLELGAHEVGAPLVAQPLAATAQGVVAASIGAEVVLTRYSASGPSVSSYPGFFVDDAAIRIASSGSKLIVVRDSTSLSEAVVVSASLDGPYEAVPFEAVHRSGRVRTRISAAEVGTTRMLLSSFVSGEPVLTRLACGAD